MSGYEDIRHLKRPSSARPKMPRQERAKIFAPFEALSGLSAAVHARDRVLVPAIIPTEYSQAQLDAKLRQLQKGEMATVIYFVPLQKTEEEVLGEYVTVTGMVEKLDEYRKVLVLEGRDISFLDIAEIRGGGLPETEKKDCAGGTNAV